MRSRIITIIMKQTIIVVDVGGYINRLHQIEKTGYEVIGITPADLATSGYTPVAIPEDWMPTKDPIPEHRLGWTELQRKSWWKSNLSAIAAIDQLKIQSDAYWIIESDCVATVERWKAIFDDHEDNTADICTTCLRTRNEEPGRARWAVTPEWGKYTNLGAIYRMSRFAVESIINASVEMREVPSENTYVNVVHRAGGTLGTLNRSQTHMNNQTMKADPEKVILNKKLINHPVKSNTYGFDI